MPSVHPDALNACNASTAASNSESAFTCLLRVCGLDARGTPGKHEAGDRGGGDGWLGWTYDDDALLPVSLMVRDLVKERSDDEDEVTVESIPDVPFAMSVSVCPPPTSAPQVSSIANCTTAPRVERGRRGSPVGMPRSWWNLAEIILRVWGSTSGRDDLERGGPVYKSFLTS
jgi:hypothetical protein